MIAVRAFGLARAPPVAALEPSPQPRTLGLIYPAMGTMLLVILGGICDSRFTRARAPFVMLGMFVGITMVMPNPLTVDQLEHGVTVTSDYIFILTGLMLLSAIWGFLLGWLLLKKASEWVRSTPSSRVRRHDTVRLCRCSAVCPPRLCLRGFQHGWAGHPHRVRHCCSQSYRRQDRSPDAGQVAHRVVGTVNRYRHCGCDSPVIRNPSL